MKDKNKKLKDKSGFSLIEMIVYVAILGIVAVLTVDFLIQIVNTYYRARAEREVISNARLLLETIEKTAAESREVYGPASRFNQDAGQLSLVTPVNPTPEHQTAFTDFWVDNGRMWMRKEGGSSIALSAPSVNVTKFRLERIMQGLEVEAVKIMLEVDYARPKFASSIILNSTAAIRGNY